MHWVLRWLETFGISPFVVLFYILCAPTRCATTTVDTTLSHIAYSLYVNTPCQERKPADGRLYCHLQGHRRLPLCTSYTSNFLPGPVQLPVQCGRK